MNGNRNITRRAAWRRVGKSTVETARLITAGRLTFPTRTRGQRLLDGDGTESIVFRETVLDDGIAADPAVLVVRFRLRWIGHRELPHKIFRVASIVNTPLFAGFPGFASKLWLANPESDVYSGVYEWGGATRAEEYARALSRLLALVSVTGSVTHRVEVGQHRDDLVAALAAPTRSPDRG